MHIAFSCFFLFCFFYPGLRKRRLPGLIQRSLFHRQVHYSARQAGMKQQNPDVGPKAAPSSTLPIHSSPARASGALPPPEFGEGGAGRRRGGEALVPGTILASLPRSPPTPTPSLRSPSFTTGACSSRRR